MNLPNALTILRIVLAFVFFFLVRQGGLLPNVLALIVFILASVTDYLDGYFAKKYNLISAFGKLMDPIADKFLILAAFLVFAQMRLIAVWMFVAIFLRETIVTGLRLFEMKRGKIVAAEKAGKYKTVSQIVAISFILIFLILRELWNTAYAIKTVIPLCHFVIDILMGIAVFLTLTSGGLYLWNNRSSLK